MDKGNGLFAGTENGLFFLSEKEKHWRFINAHSRGMAGQEAPAYAVYKSPWDQLFISVFTESPKAMYLLLLSTDRGLTWKYVGWPFLGPGFPKTPRDFQKLSNFRILLQ